MKYFLTLITLTICAFGCGEFDFTETVRLQDQVRRANRDAEAATTCIQDILATEAVIHLEIDKACIKNLVLQKYPTPQQIYDSIMAGETTYEGQVVEIVARVLSVNQIGFETATGKMLSYMEVGIPDFVVIGEIEDIKKHVAGGRYAFSLSIEGTAEYSNGGQYVSAGLVTPENYTPKIR